MIGKRASQIALALAVLLCWPNQLLAEDHADGRVPKAFVSLVEKLGNDGFDNLFLTSLYGDPRTDYLGGAVAVNLKRIERPADYDHFLSKGSIEEGREFFLANRSLLDSVVDRYGVPAETLVAVLYVESRFGRNKGDNRVFNVYSSLAVAEEPALFRAALSKVQKRYPGTTRAEVQRRVKRKAAWAYEELKSLLKIAYDKGVDVHELKGSWAGAFGMPQFIPSSFLSYAVDGDGDGKVDLDNLPDAAASIGSYLQRHGWRPSLSLSGKTRVLMTYNNSRLYAQTILAYSDRLRQGH